MELKKNDTKVNHVLNFNLVSNYRIVHKVRLNITS